MVVKAVVVVVDAEAVEDRGVLGEEEAERHNGLAHSQVSQIDIKPIYKYIITLSFFYRIVIKLKMKEIFIFLIL